MRKGGGSNRWLNQWWLVLVLLEADATLSDGVGFDNTCIVSGKGNISRIIPRLYGWVHKTLRLLSPLVVEHSVVIVSAILNPMGSLFLRFSF